MFVILRQHPKQAVVGVRRLSLARHLGRIHVILRQLLLTTTAALLLVLLLCVILLILHQALMFLSPRVKLAVLKILAQLQLPLIGVDISLLHLPQLILLPMVLLVNLH